MKVITNNHLRQHTYGFELSPAEKAEFDFLDDIDERLFIRYKGELLLDEFLVIEETMLLHHPEFKGWHGYMSDSYFSGLLIRYSEDYESFQIATYIN